MDANKLIEVMGQETYYSRKLRILGDKQRHYLAMHETAKTEKLQKYYWTLSNKYFDKKMELMDQRFPG